MKTIRRFLWWFSFFRGHYRGLRQVRNGQCVTLEELKTRYLGL